MTTDESTTEDITTPPDLLGEPDTSAILRTAGGYGRLWIAVIEEAIRSAIRGDAESKAWLASTSAEPSSFRWVCDSLGIDADFAQRRMQRRLDRATRVTC